MTPCRDVEDHTASVEAIWPFKTLVLCHITTQCYNLEDHGLNLYHCEELKSCNRMIKNNSLSLVSEGIPTIFKCAIILPVYITVHSSHRVSGKGRRCKTKRPVSMCADCLNGCFISSLSKTRSLKD